MGKLFLWNADRIKQDADHRLLNDTLINKFNNVNPNVIDWNQAIEPGFYRSEANAKNMPSGETNAAAGYVFALNNLIVQHIYIDDSLNGDSKIQMWVRRKGNNAWGDWHITSFYDPK